MMDRVSGLCGLDGLDRLDSIARGVGMIPGCRGRGVASVVEDVDAEFVRGVVEVFEGVDAEFVRGVASVVGGPPCMSHERSSAERSR